MRWHVRRPHCLLTGLVLAVLLVFSFWTVIYTTRNDQDSEADADRRTSEDAIVRDQDQETLPLTKSQSQQQQATALIGDLPCRINGEKTMTCLRDSNDEIYLPFKSFLQKYFEITGYVERKPDGEELFHWWHSNAKMQRPSFDFYDPFGVFGSFATYNVENRDRVKCISAVDGVPLSTQWTSKAYRYPIQIAQFALEHYSRNLTEPPPIVLDINDESRNDVSQKRKGDSSNGIWRIPPDAGSNSQIESVDNGEFIHFKTDANLDNPGVYASLDDLGGTRKLFTLRLELKFAANSNASFSVSLEKLDTRTFYTLHYVHSDEIVSIGERNQIYYGLGEMERNSRNGNSTSNDGWRILTRNLLTDFSKGLALSAAVNTKTGATMNSNQNSNTNSNKRWASSTKQRHRVNGDVVRLVALSFRGEGWLRRRGGVTLRSSAHLDHFRDAADWFLLNQDSDGGWPTPVRRVLAENRLKLEAGWYSAMAQGHAMSVLCRAYRSTGRREYLDAAYRASIPLSVDAERGGVRNRFLDTKYVWYEEYPTRPGTFVLNGFIYSLVGLHDLRSCLSKNRTIDKLYEDGLESLKALLPFYDTGSGSVYDLRHVTLKIAPNVARWDYHSVHVYQLLWMYLIEKEPLFLETAERWLGYARGERAKHN